VRKEASNGVLARNRAEDLSGSIRVFTTVPPLSLSLDGDMNKLKLPESSKEIYYTADEVFTDGSGLNIGSESAKAGAGIWFGENADRNIACKVPGHLPQTNNVGESLAILLALQRSPEDSPILVKSDSQVTLQMITGTAIEAEEKDWIGFSN
jgi:hypothetical protein